MYGVACTLAIGGPCVYTKQDKKDFEIMMRTHEQSRMMHLPPNGEFDWPDYRAFETCPGCCERAKPGSGERRWLLIHPLMQHFENETQRGLGVRFICRLTCDECFEAMTDGKHVRAGVPGGQRSVDVPLLDVVEAQGPITWLRDGRMSVRSVAGETLNAYTLYGFWENSGAWQAMVERYQNELHKVSLGQDLKFRQMKGERRSEKEVWEMDQIPTKEGRVCDGPGCTNVHGTRLAPRTGERRGKKVRLQECTGCFGAYYCSEQCQRVAWPEHKETCKEIQRKHREEEAKRKEKQRVDDEAKREAVLASFVPPVVTHSGGGKKKKGRKGGGKKKGKKK